MLEFDAATKHFGTVAGARRLHLHRRIRGG